MVDGRRRVRAWSALRSVGLWSDVLALRCLANASLLLHPLLVGASRTPWYGTAAHPARLTPTATDRVGELVWARYLRSG